MMSDFVIIMFVIPILAKVLSKSIDSLSNDPDLVSFLKQYLFRSFRLVGRIEDCPILEERLREAYERDPDSFEDYLQYLYSIFRKKRKKVRIVTYA